MLERVQERRIMLELIKKRGKNWLGHWLRRDCLLNDSPEGMVNRKKFLGRRRYQMIDNFMINGLYADKKRKTEKRVKLRTVCLCSERSGFGQSTMIDDSNIVYTYRLIIVLLNIC